MNSTPETTLQDLAFNIGKIRATCLMITWAIDALTTNASKSETETKRFELFAGMSFVLETMARQLDEVYQTINKEKPVR